MAESGNADEINERLAKIEEQLSLTTGQLIFASTFTAAIMRELLKSGALERSRTKKFLENAFKTIKEQRETLCEQDKLGYDNALAGVSGFFGSVVQGG